MTLGEFQHFVQQHQAWFQGQTHETYLAMDRAEKILKARLPVAVRWLWGTYGYWRGTGTATLPSIVQMTLARRPTLPLPYVVLSLPPAGLFDEFQRYRDPQLSSPNPEHCPPPCLGMVILKTDEVYGVDADCALYWVRGPAQQTPPTCTKRVIRFHNFSSYVVALHAFLESKTTTSRLANPQGWTLTPGKSFTLDEIQNNLNMLIGLLTQVILSYEQRLSTHLAESKSKAMQEATDVNRPTIAMATDVDGEAGSVREELHAAQQFRHYELMRSITHAIPASRLSDSQLSDSLHNNSGRADSQAVSPPLWPVVARSSSTWSVPQHTNSLHAGQLVLYPVDPESPSHASLLPPPSSWVTLLVDESTTRNCRSQHYLVCWLPPLSGASKPQPPHDDHPLSQRLASILASQGVQCSPRDIVILPSFPSRSLLGVA